MQQATGDGATRRARRAIAVLFTVHGVVSGSFATSIPWVRGHLGLNPGWLGLALVFTTLGAIAAMPLSARLAHRFGPRRSLRWLCLLCCATLALPALAPALVWLCLALLCLGCGLGLMDVAMNAQGVQVERHMGRSVMSGLHGMWSVGGLIGGSAGAVAAQTGLDARLQLGLTAPVLAAVALLACHWALDEAEPEHAGSAAPDTADEAPPAFALPSRGALAIGLVGFCGVFAEGASMDWSGIYLRDVTHAAPGLAASAYTAFACTMAVSRLSGDAVVRRVGAVRTVRTGGVLAALGAALVSATRTPGLAVAGYALIGIGIAVVVPLCFAAAGRISDAAPGQAIAGVATLAYASGLAAPAAVGWIAQATSLSGSFALVTVLLFGLVAGAGVLRTPPRTGAGPTAAEQAAAPTPGDGTPESASTGHEPVRDRAVRDEGVHDDPAGR